MSLINYKTILENNELLVISKPSGCHSTGEDSLEATLLNDNLLNSKVSDNGLLQRLDFETSGCLVIAKTETTYQIIKNIIQKHQWQKEYLAIVEGIFDKPLTHQGFLGSRYRGSQKVTVSDVEKKRFLYADLSVQLEQKLNNQLSLVKVTTAYGRRHQVRVQLAALGFPLLGDDLYGAKHSSGTLSNDFPKFILHAEKVAFNRIISDLIPSEISCPLPEYLANLLKN